MTTHTPRNERTAHTALAHTASTHRALPVVERLPEPPVTVQFKPQAQPASVVTDSWWMG